jgi:hypothetical protein
MPLLFPGSVQSRYVNAPEGGIVQERHERRACQVKCNLRKFWR